MTTIAILGPGAIGGTLDAVLKDHDLVLCVRTPFDRLVVEQTPTGRTIELAEPRILRSPSDVASSVDWIVAVTKTYDTEMATRWITRLLGPETKLAIVQNGVEHMDRFPAVPAERTLPVIINVPAERTAPGRIRQRGNGRVTVPAGELGDRFVALFGVDPTIEAITTDDFTTVAWEKLVLNSAGVVNALLKKPAGVVHEEKAAWLTREIAEETARVGRAVGAKLDPAIADHVLARLRSSPPDSINSLLADRLAGRPMEIDARNGVVVRVGLKHGIATPFNAMAVALIELG